MGHTPQRSCVICRSKLPKCQLSRHVLSDSGKLIHDERRVLPGRGYYVCTRTACVERFGRFTPRKRKPKGGFNG